MLLEELADRLGFVGREIVEDDVNLLPRRAQGYDLLQKGDELTAGVAGGRFFRGAARGGVSPPPSRRGCPAARHQNGAVPRPPPRGPDRSKHATGVYRG